MEALAAKDAADWPAWGHRKNAALMRADGQQVSTSTVRRALLRRGLLLSSGFRADRKAWSMVRRRVFHDPPMVRNRLWQMDFPPQAGGTPTSFETPTGGIWRLCAVVDYATKFCLAVTVTTTSRGGDAVACVRAAVDAAQRQLNLEDLRADRGSVEVLDEATGELLDQPAPIALVTDNGPCFRGDTFAQLFTGPDPLLRHVRTRVRSPQTNGVVERFFGTLKYEHLYRAIIDDGDALAVEVNLFRHTYNTRRPHQVLGDRTPRDAYRIP
ncbi:transposase InsO family protein [Kineococcus xinjiangensis]|uniref:Transposase InsO family protein n=1 Tax=Kineococcus xinjiangensis TaxID=512762 RepID=A0A2S6INV9_9ACTN|nr:transposase InsO family protein [Kineococcus xinjiangensis]